jgi:hypothetical protein
MSEPTDGDQAGGNTDDIGAPVEVVEDALARSPPKALAEAMTAWMKTRRPPRCKTRYKVGRSRPESTAPLPLIPMDRDAGACLARTEATFTLWTCPS